MKTALLFRWTARFLSLALATLLLFLAAGTGLPPLVRLSVQSLLSWCLFLTILGSLAAWRWEVLGASIAIGAIVAFYLIDFTASDFKHLPGGWVFPLLILVPACYLFAWWRTPSDDPHEENRTCQQDAAANSLGQK